MNRLKLKWKWIKDFDRYALIWIELIGGFPLYFRLPTGEMKLVLPIPDRARSIRAGTGCGWRTWRTRIWTTIDLAITELYVDAIRREMTDRSTTFRTYYSSVRFTFYYTIRLDSTVFPPIYRLHSFSPFPFISSQIWQRWNNVRARACC